MSSANLAYVCMQDKWATSRAAKAGEEEEKRERTISRVVVVESIHQLLQTLVIVVGQALWSLPHGSDIVYALARVMDGIAYFVVLTQFVGNFFWPLLLSQDYRSHMKQLLRFN